MNWFWYGYAEKGHGLYGEVDDFYRPRVKEFIERNAPYDRLPERIPYVGHHLLDDDLWLVLGKPSGIGTFYGCIVDERRYAVHDFSPYRLVSAEPPDEPVLAGVGSPLEWDEFPLPVDSVEYLEYAARLFEGLSTGEKRVTHHSIISKEQPVDGAFFEFAQGSDNAALHEIEAGVPPVQVNDEIGVLGKAVADLSRAMERADQRLGDVVTVPLLREELAAFGGELERRVGDGATAAVRGELEGIERSLNRTPDPSVRLERVEGALRGLSNQVEAIRNDYMTPPSRVWRVVRIATVAVVFVGVFVSLFTDIDNLRSMASDVRAAVFGPDATLSKVDAGVEAVKKDVEAVKTDVAAMKSDVETVKTDVAAVQTGVGEVKTSVGEVKTDVAAVQTGVGEVKTSVGEVKTDVAAVQTGVGEVKTSVGEVKTDVAAVQTGVGEVKTSVGEVKTDIAAVQTGVGEVKTSVGEVKTDVAAVQTGVGEVKTSVGEVKTDVAAGVGEVKTDIAAVQTGVGEVKTSVGEVKTDVAAVQTGVGEVKTSVGEVKTDVAAGVGEVKTDVAAVQTGVGEVKTSVGEVKTDVAAGVGEVKTDIAAVQTGVGEVKTSVGEVKTDVAAVQTGVGEVKTSVGEVKTDIAAVQTDVGAVKDAERARTKFAKEIREVIVKIKKMLENSNGANNDDS